MTGWPWPLDGIQDWFEDLWNWISSSVVGAVSIVSDWIWSAIEWVAKILGGVGGWIWDRLVDAVDWIKTAVWDTIGWLNEQLTAGLGWVWDRIIESVDWIKTAVWDTVGWLANGIQASFTWLSDKVSSGLSGVYTFVSSNIGMAIEMIGETVTSAVSGFGDWIADALSGVANALGEGLKGFWNFMVTEIPAAFALVADVVNERVISPIVSGLGWMFTKLSGLVTSLITQIEGLFRLHSPIKPEEALVIGIPAIVLALVTGGLATGLIDVASLKVVGTGLDMRALGAYVKDMINPGMFTGAVLGVLVGVGIKSPLTQFYRRQFRPEVPSIEDAEKMLWRKGITETEFKDVVARWGYGGSFESGYQLLTREIPGIGDATKMLWRGDITETEFKKVVAGLGYTDPFEAAYLALTQEVPGPGDLIRFVVREVIDPKVFTNFMGKQGFAPLISEWFWEAHWILPGRGEIVDAFHRNILSEKERDTYMILHDYKPDPRPGIEISDLKIVAGIAKTLIPRVDLRYGWEMGWLTDEDLLERYEWLGYEDDAEIMAGIQKTRALVEEVHKVRDEWIRDYLEGFIGAETLRANLAEIGIGAVRIDYYVTYARMRRTREAKKDLLDDYEDGYVKDMLTEEELDLRVRELLVDPESIDIFLRRAYTRKYKRPAPTKPEAIKIASLAYVARLFREGELSENSFRTWLSDRFYTPADVDIIVRVETLKIKPPVGA